MGQPRFGYFRWDYVSFGGPAEIYLGFDAPWYIKTIDGGIRIDGVERSADLSPPVPGETVTYDCVFLPQPSSGASTDDHRARFETVRDLLVKAPDVATYTPPGSATYYREQHGGRDGRSREKTRTGIETVPMSGDDECCRASQQGENPNRD